MIFKTNVVSIWKWVFTFSVLMNVELHSSQHTSSFIDSRKPLGFTCCRPTKVTCEGVALLGQIPPQSRNMPQSRPELRHLDAIDAVDGCNRSVCSAPFLSVCWKICAIPTGWLVTMAARSCELGIMSGIKLSISRSAPANFIANGWCRSQGLMVMKIDGSPEEKICACSSTRHLARAWFDPITLPATVLTCLNNVVIRGFVWELDALDSIWLNTALTSAAVIWLFSMACEVKYGRDTTIRAFEQAALRCRDIEINENEWWIHLESAIMIGKEISHMFWIWHTTLVSFHSRHLLHHRGTTLDTNLKEEENITLIYCRKARIPGKNAVLKYPLTGCWPCGTKYISSFAIVIASAHIDSSDQMSRSVPRWRCCCTRINQITGCWMGSDRCYLFLLESIHCLHNLIVRCYHFRIAAPPTTCPIRNREHRWPVVCLLSNDQ